MEDAQRLPGADEISDALFHHKAHGGIDNILLADAARPHALGGQAQGHAVRGSEIAVRRGGNGANHRGLRQQRHIVAHGGVAPLGADHLTQLFQARAAFQRPAQHRFARLGVGGQASAQQHLRPQEQRHLQQRPARAARQYVDGFLHLQRVAHMGAQGLLHAGNHRRHMLVHFPADIHHGFRQIDGGLQIGHQRARARFHIQHDGLGPGGEFFGKNAGGDQGDGIHRARHVPQGVKPLIGGGQMRASGPPRRSPACRTMRTNSSSGSSTRMPPGIAFQFINGAAGVAQAAPAHFQHLAAAGGHQRGQHQRGGIAHAAGGMLIHGHAPRIGERERRRSGSWPG